MSYSDFKKLETLKKHLGLKIQELHDLFETVDIKKVQASELLQEILKENFELALAIDTEKARSELIIAPILVELRKRLNRQISLFSGVDFDIDPEKGLNGRCDFIISRSPEQLSVVAPVISIVEAKDDNIKNGLPQCIAAMLAAHIFNEREKNEVRVVYGSVTTGERWQFLKLEGQIVSIGFKIYHVEKIETILGILVHIVSV